MTPVLQNTAYGEAIERVKEVTGISPASFEAKMRIYALIRLPEDEKLFQKSVDFLNDTKQVATAHFCLLDKPGDRERKAVCLFVDGALHSCLRTYKRNLIFKCNLKYIEEHHPTGHSVNQTVTVESENEWAGKILNRNNCEPLPDAKINYTANKYDSGDYAVAEALGAVAVGFIVADDKKVMKSKTVSGFKFIQSNASTV